VVFLYSDLRINNKNLNNSKGNIFTKTLPLSDQKTKQNLEKELTFWILFSFEDLVIKSSLREKANLRFCNSLERFYYNHTGNFQFGYLNSFFANAFLTYGTEKIYFWSRNLSEKNLIRKFAEKIYGKDKLIDFFSGLISSAIVVLVETTKILGTPDLKDIPMGIAGVLTHIGIKRFSLKHSKSNVTLQHEHYNLNKQI
jgi:hypothetical protein